MTISTEIDVKDGNTSSISALLSNRGPDNKISLREAIEATNNTAGADTITFDPAVFNTPKTILLTQGELTIFQSVTIDGRNPNNLQQSLGITIDAQNNSRIFSISGGSSSSVEIDSLTLTKGRAMFPGGGGAIFTTAPLTVRNSTIAGNASDFDDGGGILAKHSLTVANSTISGNTSPKNGGGIALVSTYYNGALNVATSVISGNVAGSNGGGIFAQGDYVSAHIESSRITGNRAQDHGGGISSSIKDFTLLSSEITSSYSGLDGGGAFVETSPFAPDPSITIAGTKINSNRIEATQFITGGGGIYLSASGANVTISNTVVSKNKSLGAEANAGGLNITVSAGSTVLIDQLQVANNETDDDVGGIAINSSASEVTVQNSTISGNVARFNHLTTYDVAGGMYLATTNGGTIAVKNSTISENSTAADHPDQYNHVWGAGLRVGAAAGTSISIENTTVSGNHSQRSGGGIKIGEKFQLGGEVHIRHSTITNNRADSDDNGTGSGGGINVGGSTTTVILDHTIVARNFRGTGSLRDDIAGAVTASWSLVGDSTGAIITTVPGSINRIGTGVAPIDPLLGTLGNHGGPTETHALLVGSPAIDAGNPAAMAGVGGVPMFDQRGEEFSRVLDVPGVNGSTPRIDIGAYEVGLAKIADVRLRGSSWTSGLVYSFAELTAAGKQLDSIFTQNVDTIEVVFSEDVDPVLVTTANVRLLGSDGVVPGGVTYNPATFTATWTRPGLVMLPADKYRLEILDVITDRFGRRLDGEWDDLIGSNDKLTSKDDVGFDWNNDRPRAFLPGDGVQGTTIPATPTSPAVPQGGKFGLHFAYLPGDYNQDGIVLNFGPNSDLLTLRDGDGHTSTQTAGDIGVVNTAFNAGNTYLKASRFRGDYNDNEIVDASDYFAWKELFLSTSDLRADAGLNGIVDGADYSVWRDNIGAPGTKHSAWSAGPGTTTILNGFLPEVLFGEAPRVANVTFMRPIRLRTTSAAGFSCERCRSAGPIRSRSRLTRT